MPAKKQIPKEAILKGALALARKHGWDGLNARTLAAELGCSTQPIYLSFPGMKEVKLEVFELIKKEYLRFVDRVAGENDYILDRARGYVLFALEEREYYRALFLSGRMDRLDMKRLKASAWSERTIHQVMANGALDRPAALSLLFDLWTYSNGLASLVAFHSLQLSEEDVDSMLKNYYARIQKGYAQK